MKPTLALMSYGGVAAPVVAAIMRDADLFLRGWHVAPRGDDAAIDRARSKAASEFIQTGRDVLVMVDHDIEWRPGDLQALAERAQATKGIVGAVVSKRVFRCGFGGRLPQGTAAEIGSNEMIALPADTYVGGAFTAYHRDALAAIAATMPRVRDGFYPLFLPMVHEGSEGVEYLSEDWAICHRAREAGCSVHAWMRPQTRHWGSYGFSPLDGAYDAE